MPTLASEADNATFSTFEVDHDANADDGRPDRYRLIPVTLNSEKTALADWHGDTLGLTWDRRPLELSFGAFVHAPSEGQVFLVVKTTRGGFTAYRLF